MSFSKQPTRQFVASVPFHANIFTYTTSYNAQTAVTTGTLSAVSGATAANCPAGRVLRENGKKLFPAAHPGVSTYMVGVIDSITFMFGYIDPDSPVFAVSNTDVPGFYANPVDPVTSRADASDPVYTNGVVVSKGQIRNIGAAGQRVALDGTQPTIVIDATQGSFVYIDGNGNNTVSVGNLNFGDRLFIQVTGSGNITFSTGFGVNTNNIAKNLLMISFVCDGFHMIEQSRTYWTNTY